MKNEIIYNIVNSLLAGALVFTGAFIDGAITEKEILAAAAAAIVIALNQFKKFWKTQNPNKNMLSIGAFI